MWQRNRREHPWDFGPCSGRGQTPHILTELLAVFMALPQEEPLMKEQGIMVRTSLSMKSWLRIPSIHPTLQWRTLPRRLSGSLPQRPPCPPVTVSRNVGCARSRGSCTSSCTCTCSGSCSLYRGKRGISRRCPLYPWVYLEQLVNMDCSHCSAQHWHHLIEIITNHSCQRVQLRGVCLEITPDSWLLILCIDNWAVLKALILWPGQWEAKGDWSWISHLAVRMCGKTFGFCA